LDGSKILALILPENEANIYLSAGNIGMFIIIILLLFPICRHIIQISNSI
jgi:hypothetical protein